MGYASQAGRARTSSTSPQAHAICDRCGFRYNFVDLMWQWEWRGATLQNIKILVCRRCIDKPQENIRSIVLPADPVPIINARVQDFSLAEDSVVGLESSARDPVTNLPIPSQTTVSTEDGQGVSMQTVGAPVGLTQPGVMPQFGKDKYGVPFSVASVNGFGTNTVSVTCTAPHGLSNGDVVSVEGVSAPGANGFYNVAIVSATAFSYTTAKPVAAGSILENTTRIVKALVGVPLDTTLIPNTGL